MEVIMDVFALSYTVDEFFQLKGSGPSFYFETVWNLFDVPIYIIFILFIVLRIRAFCSGSIEMSDFAYDFLACNSILLWPRLFAALDHYKFFGTMLIVLRQMLLDAGLFIALSLIFYLGFLQAFFALHDNKKSYGEIAWLLLQVFFGSAFLGFEQATEISEQFGAPLMVVFVAISVLMLYTLLISIFSQTFSEVSANAKEEFMYLFSVKVMEEVKSDVLYEFQPPFNILAGIIVLPCRWLCPPRVAGKVSRVLLRIFYFPELVCIWVFEMMVLRKRQPYIPVRPGNVEHQRTYNTGQINTELDHGIMGGGVARRRQEERGAVASNIIDPVVETSVSPLDSHHHHHNHHHHHSSDAEHTPESSSSTIQQVQRLDQLNVNSIGQSDTNEILSPYFENIRRYRDSHKYGSVVTTPSQRSENECGLDQLQNSYYSPIPIGMGITRQGSIPGYRKSRHGTEATLANTYQAVSSSYHGVTPGDLSSIGEGGALPPDQYSHHQFYDTNPSHNRQEDVQELGHIMEIRQVEMQARMDQIESKLDLLIAALASQNKKDD
ncbi:hypothetical protein BGZ76_004024 [Entomortierella beljakovae]|nr:hypothetical protein BGZ76_004024 [Entomortierella beljakovae]